MVYVYVVWGFRDKGRMGVVMYMDVFGMYCICIYVISYVMDTGFRCTYC